MPHSTGFKALLTLIGLMAISLLAAVACGTSATPEPVVVERTVEVPVTVVVERTVEVPVENTVVHIASPVGINQHPERRL